MSTPPASAFNRIPRAGIDPILSAEDALAVFSLELTAPLTFRTLAMFIDSSGCGGRLMIISGTDEPHMVVDVADMLAVAAAGRAHISGMVLASIRPGGGVLPDDDTLWFEMDAVLQEHCLVLLDWLVVGRGGTRSMIEELGVPSRWPSRT